MSRTAIGLPDLCAKVRKKSLPHKGGREQMSTNVLKNILFEAYNPVCIHYAVLESINSHSYCHLQIL